MCSLKKNSEQEHGHACCSFGEDHGDVYGNSIDIVRGLGGEPYLQPNRVSFL